ncbi:MAG: AAA family ATPase [Candidatus Omnitrophica bacterium]|nr:AAA family ATPase [Candidatus Omnitrophota bacterium]
MEDSVIIKGEKDFSRLPAPKSLFNKLFNSRNILFDFTTKFIRKIFKTGVYAGNLTAGLIKQGNIASGTWTQEYHKELNSLIQSLINKQDTDLSSNYDIASQKKELVASLTEYINSLNATEKEKLNKIIQESELSISSIDQLINQIIEILPQKSTNFYYLKPAHHGVFYSSRGNGTAPLIAAAHFGHRRDSSDQSKVNNNIYLAEPSFALKSHETQLGVILHELIHCVLGAGDAEHALAARLQSSYEGFMLKKQMPAEFFHTYRRYYELKNEILAANENNDDSAYTKAREELIKTIDGLRALTETAGQDQFKKAFDLLKIEQIENQDEKTFMLGTFDEFYHLSTPDYDQQEIQIMQDIMREMSEGFKKWHDPAEIYSQGMKAMQPYHAKNLLPKHIADTNEMHSKYLSLQIDQITRGFINSKATGACFLRGFDYNYVLTKGLKNREVSLPFLKASIKHELIHYFAFNGLLPINYNREDITTAMTVIELLENKQEDVFTKYDNFFTPVGDKLFAAGRSMQKQGKVILDEEYLLKTAFELYQTNEKTKDQALMLVRDPVGRNPMETAQIMHQVNDMRQRVIGVIIAGALIEHHESTGEPLLETLIDFFKQLSERIPLPSVKQLMQTLEIYKQENMPEREIKEVENLLAKARKRQEDVETKKNNIMSWAKRATGIPALSYVEAKEDMAQWAFLPTHQRIVGVEQDLYRIDQRAAYGLVVTPVFEAKYGIPVREKIIEAEYKDELYFDLLMRVMDTPRIMAFGWNEYPGTINWVKAIFEERFKEDNMLIAQTVLGARSRPLQYLDSFMYRWVKGIDTDKRLRNSDVKTAIDNTRDAYAQVMATINPEELYAIVKNEIWPEFKKLLDAEIKEQQEMEAFREQHRQPQMSDQDLQNQWNNLSDQEKQEIRDQIDQWWDSLSDQEKQDFLEKMKKRMQDEANDYMAQSSRAQQGKPRTSPNPVLPDDNPQGSGTQMPQQGNGNDDLERLNQMAQQLNRMAERMRKKANALENQASGNSENTDSLSEKAEEIDHNAGGADMSDSGKEMVETAQDTADGFGSLKDQTDKFKKRTESFNSAANQVTGSESSEEMKQSADSLNNVAREMDDIAKQADKTAKQALDEAKQTAKMIKQKGTKDIDQIRYNAKNIAQKADKLADYAKQLADKAQQAGEQAQQSQSIASQMEAESAGKKSQAKPDENNQTGQPQSDPKNWNWDESKLQDKPDFPEGKSTKSKPDKEKPAGKEDKDSVPQDKPKSNESKKGKPEGDKAKPAKPGVSEEPKDGDKGKELPLTGIDKLAKKFKDDNKPDAKEFDLSKYSEDQEKDKSKDTAAKSTPSKSDQPTEEEIKNLEEHNQKMNKMRAENFLKRNGITVEENAWYQQMRRQMMAQTSNIEKELQKILVPGGGNEFLYHRSYGELDDDALAEIPAGRRKIFKQQLQPKKKKVIISLLVDISGSTFPDPGKSLEDSILFREALTALAFQEALKKFENRSDVELEFEIAAYNEYSYHKLKDYQDKITIKRAFEVIEDILTIKTGKDGTSDYQALKAAIKRMRERKLGKDPEAKKIILNMNDGNDGLNSEAIQALYPENPDLRILSFGIDENEEIAKAIAQSYGSRFGIAVTDINNVASVVMKHLRLELRRPVNKNNIGNIVANVMLFGMPTLAALAMNALQGFTLNLLGEVNELPLEEPVYEGSKFQIARENGKEYLVYRDPDTGDEKIKIQRGSANNKLVPDIEWNAAFENEQNIGTLLKMFQILYAEDGQESNRMRNLLLLGETGTGKDVLAAYALKLLNRNRRMLPIHKRTDKNQLIARRIFFIKKNAEGKLIKKTGWADSELIEAAKNGDTIFLNELNKAESENLGVINNLLSLGKFFDKDGKEHTVHPDFRVIAMANPPGGIYNVNDLSWEIRDRFTTLKVEYLSEEDEIDLLSSWALVLARKTIRNLVTAAWNIRARYFGFTSRKNMLDEDEVPAELGMNMKRPLSTGELRKIVEHFAMYPYDLKNRAWSIINRHFSLDNEDPMEVKEMKEEIRSEFEGLGFQDKIKEEEIIIQKENNKIVVEKDELTGIETRFWEITPDIGGEAVKYKLIDQGPKDKNEKPEQVIPEVQYNLVKCYDILKDISLGNHLLFTGHAGTGKNTIADFVSYMLAGGAYQIAMNKLIEPGDLTAWQGFSETTDEERIEWIKSFIVRAMEEGKPVIIDEVNKADSGVVAILNSLLETGDLTLPNGDVVTAQPGFVIIALMNPPIPGVYEVEPLSGEFLRRFSVHKFDYLPEEQEYEILDNIANHRVNEKYLRRLIKATRKLRELYVTGGGIPAPPALRPLIRTVERIRDYGDKLVFGAKQRRDKQIFECFEANYSFDKPEHQKIVENVFKDPEIELLPKQPINKNPPDAIDKLLDGEPLVERRTLELEPNTGDKLTDNILKVLQLNMDAIIVAEKINELDGFVDTIITSWSETNFKQHLASALYFKEIVSVTSFIRGMAEHTDINKKALEQLEQKMEKHLLAYGWPETFFIEDFDPEDHVVKSVPMTEDIMDNESFGLIQIFNQDADFVQEHIEKIIKSIKTLSPEFNGQLPHELIDQMGALYAYQITINNLEDKHGLDEQINFVMDLFPYQFKYSNDLTFLKDFIDVYPFADKPDSMGGDLVRKMLPEIEKLSAQERAEIFIPLIKKNPELFVKLYKSLVHKAIPSLKAQRQDAQKLCAYIYQLGYQTMKSFEGYVDQTKMAETVNEPVLVKQQSSSLNPFSTENGIEQYVWKDDDGNIAENILKGFGDSINSVTLDSLGENFIVTSGIEVTNIAFEPRIEKNSATKTKINNTFHTTLPNDAITRVYDSAQTKNFFFFATDQGVYIANRQDNPPHVSEAYNSPATVFNRTGYIVSHIKATGIAVKDTPNGLEIYIINSSEHKSKIQKLTNENGYSAPIDTLSGLKNVKALSFNKDGELLAAWEEEESVGVVVIQTSDGYENAPRKMKVKAMSSIDEKVLPDEGIKEITSIVEDDQGFIYISGKQSNNILVLKRSGKTVSVNDLNNEGIQTVELLNISDKQIKHKNLQNPVDLEIKDNRLYISCEIGHHSQGNELKIYTLTKPAALVSKSEAAVITKVTKKRADEINAGAIDIVSEDDGPLVMDAKSGIIYTITNANTRITLIMPPDSNGYQETICKSLENGSRVLAIAIEGDYFFAATEHDGIKVYKMDDFVTGGSQQYRSPDFSRNAGFELGLKGDCIGDMQFEGIAVKKEKNKFIIYSSDWKTGKVYKFSSENNYEQPIDEIILESPQYLHISVAGELIVAHSRLGKTALSKVNISADKMRIVATTDDPNSMPDSDRIATITSDQFGTIYLGVKGSSNILMLKQTNKKVQFPDREYEKIEILESNIILDPDMSPRGMTWEENNQMVISYKGQNGSKSGLLRIKMEQFISTKGSLHYMLSIGDAIGVRLSDKDSFYWNLGKEGIVLFRDKDSNVYPIHVGIEINDIFVTDEHIVVATVEDIRVYSKKTRLLDPAFYDNGIYTGIEANFSSVFVDQKTDSLIFSVTEWFGILGFKVKKNELLEDIAISGRIKIFSDGYNAATYANGGITIWNDEQKISSGNLNIGRIIDFFEAENQLIYVIGEDSKKIHVLRRSDQDAVGKGKKLLVKAAEIGLDNAGEIKQLIGLDHKDGKTVVVYSTDNQSKITLAELNFDPSLLVNQEAGIIDSLPSWQQVTDTASLPKNISQSVDYLNAIAVDPITDAVVLASGNHGKTINIKTKEKYQEVSDDNQDVCKTEHFELIGSDDIMLIRFADQTLSLLDVIVGGKIRSITAREVRDNLGKVNLEIYYLDKRGPLRRVIAYDVLSKRFKDDPADLSYLKGSEMRVVGKRQGSAVLSPPINSEDNPVLFEKIKFSKDNKTLIATQKHSFYLLKPSPAAEDKDLLVFGSSDSLLDDAAEHRVVSNISKKIIDITDDGKGNYYVLGDTGRIGVYEMTGQQKEVPSDSPGWWIFDRVKHSIDKDITIDSGTLCIVAGKNGLYAGILDKDTERAQVWKYELSSAEVEQENNSFGLKSETAGQIHESPQKVFASLLQAILSKVKVQDTSADENIQTGEWNELIDEFRAKLLGKDLQGIDMNPAYPDNVYVATGKESRKQTFNLNHEGQVSSNQRIVDLFDQKLKVERIISIDGFEIIHTDHGIWIFAEGCEPEFKSLGYETIAAYYAETELGIWGLSSAGNLTNNVFYRNNGKIISSHSVEFSINHQRDDFKVSKIFSSRDANSVFITDSTNRIYRIKFSDHHNDKLDYQAFTHDISFAEVIDITQSADGKVYVLGRTQELDDEGNIIKPSEFYELIVLEEKHSNRGILVKDAMLGVNNLHVVKKIPLDKKIIKPLSVRINNNQILIADAGQENDYGMIWSSPLDASVSKKTQEQLTAEQNADSNAGIELPAVLGKVFRHSSAVFKQKTPKSEIIDKFTDKSLFYLNKYLLSLKNNKEDIASLEEAFQLAVSQIDNQEIKPVLHIIQALIDAGKLKELLGNAFGLNEEEFFAELVSELSRALDVDEVGRLGESFSGSGFLNPNIVLNHAFSGQDILLLLRVFKNLIEDIETTQELEAFKEQPIFRKIENLLTKSWQHAFKKLMALPDNEVEEKVKLFIGIIDLGEEDWLDSSLSDHVYEKISDLKQMEQIGLRAKFYAQIIVAFYRNVLDGDKHLIENSEAGNTFRIIDRAFLLMKTNYDAMTMDDYDKDKDQYHRQRLEVFFYINEALSQLPNKEERIDKYYDEIAEKYLNEMSDYKDMKLMLLSLKILMQRIEVKDSDKIDQAAEMARQTLNLFNKKVKLSDDPEVFELQIKDKQDIAQRYQLCMDSIKFLDEPYLVASLLVSWNLLWDSLTDTALRLVENLEEKDKAEALVELIKIVEKIHYSNMDSYPWDDMLAKFYKKVIPIVDGLSTSEQDLVMLDRLYELIYFNENAKEIAEHYVKVLKKDETKEKDIITAVDNIQAEDIPRLIDLLDRKQLEQFAVDILDIKDAANQQVLRESVQKALIDLFMIWKTGKILEIPAEFINALWMLAISNNPEYIEQSMAILAKHDQLLSQLLEDKDFFKKLIACIEKYQDINSESLIQRLGAVDVQRKSISIKKPDDFNLEEAAIEALKIKSQEGLLAKKDILIAEIALVEQEIEQKGMSRLQEIKNFQQLFESFSNEKTSFGFEVYPNTKGMFEDGEVFIFIDPNYYLLAASEKATMNDIFTKIKDQGDTNSLELRTKLSAEQSYQLEKAEQDCIQRATEKNKLLQDIKNLKDKIDSLEVQILVVNQNAAIFANAHKQKINQERNMLLVQTAI